MGSAMAFSHKFLSNPRIPHDIAISRTSSQKSIGLAHSSAVPDVNISKGRKLPIFLFDVMGTIVRDPFYEDIPVFFGLSMKELLEVKHPTAWIEFEKGIITEEELATKFFSDGRAFDFEGKRKPEIEAYLEVSKHLGVPPASCLFIDDRLANVEAASKLGMAGILFKNANKLEQDLISLGIDAGSLQ